MGMEKGVRDQESKVAESKCTDGQKFWCVCMQLDEGRNVNEKY